MTPYVDADDHVVVKGTHDWLPALCVGQCAEGATISSEKLGIEDHPVAYEI